MSTTVIKVENVAKQYRLGVVGTGSIAHDLNRWWYKARGKEDPYLKIGEENDRTKKSMGEYVWALKDVSFDVEKGDVVGIIGRNGAGKSTLLKILSRTTLPTTGTLKVKGKIASLLEVGTGFHPELTGKENIFLNGAILGMTKTEIRSKFDEIVDFSGVEKYIDTPVKRYSSGMYVRLAFAVAAHLDPEILIVDEVLAVGDAEFQKKALGKMQAVSQSQGRTVLFVSHNMGVIASLCNKSIYLVNGMVSEFDDTKNVIELYLKDSKSAGKTVMPLDMKPRISGSYGIEAKFSDCFVKNENNDRSDYLLFGERLSLQMKLTSNSEFKEVNVGIRIENALGMPIAGPRSHDVDVAFDLSGNLEIEATFTQLILAPGSYYITLTLISRGVCLDQVEQCCSFDVRNEPVIKQNFKPHSGAWGAIVTPVSWRRL